MNLPTRWTIAIPTCNGSAFLESTLRGVLAQSDTDFELLICDDASRDDTLKVVLCICGKRARIVVNDSGKSMGLASNWNRCVAEASGDWITILHQDDLLEPEFLEEHRRIAELHKSAGLIIGPVKMVDATGHESTLGEDSDFRWPDRFALWPAGALSRVLVKSNPIRCPGVSFRKELHTRLGGFDANWKYVVDWDFWHRLGQITDVAVLGDCLASQRWHHASETQRLARGSVDLEENARLMRKILATEAFPAREKPAIEKRIRTRMARAWTNRAYQAACRGDRVLQWRSLREASKESPGVVLRILACSPRTMARLLVGASGSQGIT